MTDAVQPGPESRGAGGKRLKYFLIASLALNLLVVGAVAGTMIGFGKHHARHGHGRGEDFGLMGLTRMLPEERRKEIRKELRGDRAKLRPFVDEIRTARREAADVLAAEPFDRAALERSVEAAAEKERALRQAALSAFLGHAERLTVEERRMLADWWRKKNEPLKERKGKKAKDGDEAAAKDGPPGD